MNAKAFLSIEWVDCGGAHEILGISAPICPMDGWLEGSCGWLVVLWWGGWCCAGEGWGDDGVVVYWVGGCVGGVLVRGGSGWSYFKILIIKIFHFINTYPLNISKVSLCHCTYTHPPTNSYDVKKFHFMNTHPPIEHIQSVTHATVHILSHPQTVMMSKYFIL